MQTTFDNRLMNDSPTYFQCRVERQQHVACPSAEYSKVERIWTKVDDCGQNSSADHTAMQTIGHSSADITAVV